MSDNGPALVIFDCDGTLVDGQHVIIDAMTLTFERAGLSVPDPADIRHIIGLSLEHAIEKLVPSASETKVLELAEAYKASFFDLMSKGEDRHEPLYPGIENLVTGLDDDGYLLAVATGKSQRGLRRVLAGHDMLDRFISLQTADIRPSKPHPAMIQYAVSDAGTSAARSMMIGDTSYDMEMARAAGALAIGVTWGYHTPDVLQQSGAHHIVEDAEGLNQIIRKHLLNG